MTISSITLMYFSPTGTTKLVTTKFGEMLSKHLQCSISEFDLTDCDSFAPTFPIGEDTLLVISIPVYSGRVPKTMLERLENLQGTKTPAVLLATYGHRHYDDSLLELKTILYDKNIISIGASAVVSKHNMVDSIGVGRPNQDDFNLLSTLAEAVVNKLDAAQTIDSIVPVNVGGNTSYREYMATPIKPHGTSKCNSCGLCAKKCPVNAILLRDPKVTDSKKCITCMRCINICPTGARKFHFFERVVTKNMLKKKCAGQRITEIFI